MRVRRDVSLQFIPVGMNDHRNGNKVGSYRVELGWVGNKVSPGTSIGRRNIENTNIAQKRGVV